MKKSLKILLILVMFLATPAFALSNDLFRADDSVSVSDDLNGSSFIAGNSVEIDSKVNGMLFSAGNVVNQSGESDYLFTAGNIVRVDSQKARDAFIAGSEVNIKSSLFERDLYVAGAKVTYDSEAGRNVYIGGSDVVISGTVNGNLTIYAENITIEKSAKIIGELKYTEDSKASIDDNAKIGSIKKIKGEKAGAVVEVKPTFTTKLMNSIFSLANSLILGLLLMLIFPKLFESISNLKSDTILSNLAFGALTLIVLPIAALILMLTFVGLSAGLLAIAFYVIAICLSTIISTYYFANIIFKDKISNKYLLLLLGLTILYIIKLIPFISILASISLLCVGLGIIINLIFKRK